MFEDARHMKPLSEVVFVSVLLHIALLSLISSMPSSVLQVPRVIEPFNATERHKGLRYLETPVSALLLPQSDPTLRSVSQNVPVAEKQMSQASNNLVSSSISKPELSQPALPLLHPPPLLTIPARPRSTLEAPPPQAVPSIPSFVGARQTPVDLLREVARAASRIPNQGADSQPRTNGFLLRPGGGDDVELLSDTKGVDFTEWLIHWHTETENSWRTVMPYEVGLRKSGTVVIRFKVLPDGRVIDGSIVLEGRSGDTALDRAAWGALTASAYPPLPKEFLGPYLELRASFMYNIMKQR
jgi:TonB family protein